MVLRFKFLLITLHLLVVFCRLRFASFPLFRSTAAAVVGVDVVVVVVVTAAGGTAIIFLIFCQ